MKKILFILLLLPTAAWATAPVVDSTAAFSRSPWSFNVIWTAKDTLLAGVQSMLYYEPTGGDTTTWDSTSAVTAGITNGIGQDLLFDKDTLRTCGIISICHLVNNTEFVYRLGCWLTGDSDTTWNIGTVTTVNSTDTATIVADTNVFVCTEKGRYYKLDGDKDATWSGLWIVNDSITIDLQGYELTYGDIDSVLVPNWSFETAGDGDTTAYSWVFSDGDVIKRLAGHRNCVDAGEVSSYDGDWSVVFLPDNFDDATDTAHYIETASDITIPRGTDPDSFGVYMVSVRLCAYPKDTYTKSSVVARIQLDEDTTIFYGDNWQSDLTWVYGEAIRPFENTGDGAGAHALGNRGFTRIGFRVFPGVTDVVGKIRIWVHGPCTNLDSLRFDCVRVEPCNYFGIASPYNGAVADVGVDSLYLIPPANQTVTSTYGISDGANHLTILNGTIRMAKRSPWPFGMNAIHTSGVEGVDIDNTTLIGVTLKTFGEVTAPYFRPHADYDTIMFCKILDSATGIWQRDDNIRAVDIGYDDGNNYFGFNYLTTLRQCGVGIRYQDTTKTMNNTLEHNYIRINAKHMNGVAAVCWGTIRGNRIITYADAADDIPYWGGGNCITVSAPNELIYDNYCSAEAGWGYEQRRFPAYAIQIEETQSRNTEVYNSILKARQWIDQFTTTYTSGVQMTTCGGDNYFHNNYILALDTTSSSVAVLDHGHGVHWIYDEGASGENLRGNHFYQNHIEASAHPVCIDFPSLWSNGGLTFSQDTFYKYSVATDGFKTFRIDYDDSVSDTNCVYQTGTANDDIEFNDDGNKTTWWSIFVQTGNDGDSVWAMDNVGNYYAGGLTSGSEYELMLRELVDDQNTDLDTTFTPYVIHARNGSGEDSATAVSVTLWDTVSVALSAASATSRKVKARR